MNSAINEVYGSLLMDTRPHIIRDDEDNERSITLLEALLGKDKRSPEEEELVEVLGVLIESYEKRFRIEPEVAQADIVRHLMNANTLTAKDMETVLGTKSAVSMVLSGERALSKSQIVRLSERFHVSPEVFFVQEEKPAEKE